MHDVAFKSAGNQLIHVNKIDFGMIVLFFFSGFGTILEVIDWLIEFTN